MTLHTIEPVQGILHGSFSRDLPPALTIDAGDTVRFRTLDAGWNLEPGREHNVFGHTFSPRVPGRDDGHALCGPIEIRGARPGMVLEVRIEDIRPGTWGWTTAGVRQNEVTRKLGVHEAAILDWTLDPERMQGKNQYGHTIALRPFMGVMGLPPAEPGLHSTIPPRFCGGNMDCKELVVGSKLYLPITVPGALFSTGDGHAVQGDGEVSGVAIECPIERVDLTFFLHDDIKLTTPRADTPTAWVTLGFDTDLHEATLIALNAMLDLMQDLYHVPRPEALALASLVADLHISQIVNGGTFSVHAILPHHALQGL
ncbi:MAG: acetamidase/formamidase family protein [Ktedonobacteraceae bacterium]